jgi:hypothetical protein
MEQILLNFMLLVVGFAAAGRRDHLLVSAL